MKRISITIAAVLVALAFTLPVQAQSYGSFRDTGGGLATTQPWCWEGTQMAGWDVCIQRYATGIASINNLGSQLVLGALGTYQGTTAVGITDTAFHALAAAASDIPIPANLINTAGKAVKVHADGVYTNGAASLLNAEVMLCQTSGCATGTVVSPAGCAIVTTNQANNLTNGQFSLDCSLIASATVGSSGTFMAKGTACAELGSATTVAASCFLDTATAVSAAVDETKAEYVNIGFKFSTSNAGNSATVLSYRVEQAK